MHWVWRDSADCATNHHLSYARSRDLLQWESAFGDKVELPITFENKSLWVDPIPSGGGIINGGHRLFLDDRQRPVITYHKADTKGSRRSTCLPGRRRMEAAPADRLEQARRVQRRGHDGVHWNPHRRN